MQQPTAQLSASTLAIHGEGDRLALDGVLDIRTLSQASKALRRWLDKRRGGRARRALDLDKLSGLDTTGALFLWRLGEQGVELTGVREEHQALFGLIGGLEHQPLRKPASLPRWRQLVIHLGKAADEAWHDTYDVIAFVGRATNALGYALAHPRYLRLPSISRQIAETGIDALPIIGLMAIMISVVIGYQGVAQLRPYGGEEFTINLVAVSMLREMGVLITAIMVAGRSGSAFAAEIGVMKAREEIDALNVMGMDAMNVLVVPRLIGLIITLPLLTFFSDIMGLLGGAMISQSLLHVSPVQYVDRVHHALAGGDLAVGLIKAPSFGFLIPVNGRMHRLSLKGAAANVVYQDTGTAVNSIFLAIVLDSHVSARFDQLLL